MSLTQRPDYIVFWFNPLQEFLPPLTRLSPFFLWAQLHPEVYVPYHTIHNWAEGWQTSVEQHAFTDVTKTKKWVLGSHLWRAWSFPQGSSSTPVMNHLPEGSSFSRLPTQVPFTFRTISHHSSQGTLFVHSTNIYSFINSKHLWFARHQVLFSNHKKSCLNTLFPAPKPLDLRFLVSGIQFHNPSSQPPSTTDRVKTQELLFTGLFLALPYLFISIIWTQKPAQLKMTTQ